MSTTNEPKARGISFSGAMVKAILSGAKTQTRRPIKPQPEWLGGTWRCGGYKGLREQYFLTESCVAEWLFHEHYGTLGTPYGCYWPDGKADLLYVKEKFWIPKSRTVADTCFVLYDLEHSEGRREVSRDRCGEMAEGAYVGDYVQRQARFMPRWASRITLQICDIRVEQLGQISEADAIAEGVEWDKRRVLLPGASVRVQVGSPICSFKKLWDEVYKQQYAFERDRGLWVWIIEFRRVTP